VRWLQYDRAMTAQRELEGQVRSLWDFGDPVTSHQRFVDAAAATSDPAARHVLVTQQARALGLQQRFDEADALLTAITPTDDHVAARVAIERGRVLNSSGRPAEATLLFAEAERLALQADVPSLAIDAIHMLAIAAPDPATARSLNERAIREAGTSDDPAAGRWLGSLLNNLGWSHHDAGEFDDALAVFRRAETYFDAEGTESQQFIAHWAVARALRSLARYDEALAIQERLSQEPQGIEDGYVSEELGELMLALDRPAEAAPHFARAHALLSGDPWLDDKERLDRLAALANGVK
jgi:tetratricopeptide (TPR) repeat protein